MEDIKQFAADKIILRLLSENALLRAHYAASSSLLIIVLSEVHGISRKKAEKIYNEALKPVESYEQTQLALSLGAADKEISDLYEGK